MLRKRQPRPEGPRFRYPFAGTQFETRVRTFVGDTWRWLVFGGLCVALFWLVRPYSGSETVELNAGDIPADTIQAPVALNVEDKAETQIRRDAAEARAQPVFNQNRVRPGEDFKADLDRLFAARDRICAATVLDGRPASAGSVSPVTSSPSPVSSVPLIGPPVIAGATIPGPAANRSARAAALQAESVIPLATTTYLTLVTASDEVFDRAVRQMVYRVRDQIHGPGVVATDSEKSRLETRGARLNRPGREQAVTPSMSGVLTIRELTDLLQDDADAVWPHLEEGPGPLHMAAVDIAKAFIEPSLTFLPKQTEEAVAKAIADVPPAMVQFKKDEIIVERGRPVTPVAALALQELRKRDEGRGAFLSNLGWLFLSILPVLALWGYLRRFEPRYFDDPRMVTVLAFLILFIVGWARTAGYLTGLTPQLADIHFATPVAMAGILVTVLANGWLGTFVVMILAYLVGIMVDWRLSIKVVTVCMLSGVVGAYSVTQVRRRTVLYRAGLWSGVAALGAVLGVAFIENPTSVDLNVNKEAIFFALTWAMINAIQSCGLANFFLVPMENFLGVITDIKLLEMGVKSDLLRELEAKAPGSYQHSLNVATLSESAAESIGANALLCRVGAYYHDIGKMEKPQYFTENQRTPEDRMRHEKLSPNMSVRIIRNHVREGLELAAKHKLPRAIQDFIAEHHGTTKIGYFYERAVAQADGESLTEQDFRYPGPKPQTIESAIMMIADSLDAAFRSVGPKTDGETMQLVRRIINDKFIDGQFEECALTLKDLHRLSQTFSRCLINMRHQRVEYPEPVRPPAGRDVLRVNRRPARTGGADEKAVAAAMRENSALREVTAPKEAAGGEE